MPQTSTNANAAKADGLPGDAGVLLVGHGTRDRRGQGEFLEAAEMLQARLPHTAVEACFLELASPDISRGVARLRQAGVRRFIAAPLLLFAAGHAKRDIPEAIAAAVRQHAGKGRGETSWQMAAPLGDHPAVLELSARRFDETLACHAAGDGGDITPAQETALLFVGRGSSDVEAIENVRAFADRRHRLRPVAASQVCFLAAAEPPLAAALDWAASQPPRHIVVQPHLLFHGRLIQDIDARIAQIESRSPHREKRWHVAGHLGPSPEVIEALHDRLLAAARTSAGGAP